MVVHPSVPVLRVRILLRIKYIVLEDPGTCHRRGSSAAGLAHTMHGASARAIEAPQGPRHDPGTAVLIATVPG